MCYKSNIQCQRELYQSRSKRTQFFSVLEVKYCYNDTDTQFTENIFKLFTCNKLFTFFLKIYNRYSTSAKQFLTEAEEWNKWKDLVPIFLLSRLCPQEYRKKHKDARRKLKSSQKSWVLWDAKSLCFSFHSWCGLENQDLTNYLWSLVPFCDPNFKQSPGGRPNGSWRPQILIESSLSEWHIYFVFL